MPSSRGSQLNHQRNLCNRESNSPTLASTHSEKSIWVQRSYRYEPVPVDIRRRLLHKKVPFIQDSEDEEEIIAVQEEEQGENIETKRKLPKFKLISDWDEFSSKRNGRIYSEHKRHCSSERCRSVEYLRLPQVQQEKRQDDELRRTVSKLTEIRDNNQFDQKRTKRSSNSYTDVVSRVQSSECPQYGAVLPEEILENDAEETKSVKLNDKSIIDTELEKLIVDELDEKRKKKEELCNEEIESIIEEQKQEEDVDTDKLRHSLEKFQNELSYFNEESHYRNTSNERSSEVVQQEDSEQSITIIEQ